jgi:hypothetical protein
MECHLVAQASDAAKGVLEDRLPAAMVEVVASQVLIGGASVEHVVDEDKDGVGNIEDGTVLSTTGSDAMILGSEIGVSGMGGCLGSLGEGQAEPGVGIPGGAGLSYTHSGMYGIFTIIELVRQLRGQCGPRQVQGAKTGLAHGPGGIFAADGTVIWGAEKPS